MEEELDDLEDQIWKDEETGSRGWRRSGWEIKSSADSPEPIMFVENTYRVTTRSLR